MLHTVVCAGRRFEVGGIVFDKDGTLIDLDLAWGSRARRWLDRIAVEVEGADPDELAAEIGLEGNSIVPGSVLAAGTAEELIATLDAALAARRLSCAPGFVAGVVRSGSGAIAPIGDVAETLRRLMTAGLRCGVLTSDERAQTLDDLATIGAEVRAVVCADDGFATKPAPDGFLALADLLGVEPSRLLMVGDSPSDRAAAEAAGAAGFVLVDARGTTPGSLRSIDEIEVA